MRIFMPRQLSPARAAAPWTIHPVAQRPASDPNVADRRLARRRPSTARALHRVRANRGLGYAERSSPTRLATTAAPAIALPRCWSDSTPSVSGPRPPPTLRVGPRPRTNEYCDYASGDGGAGAGPLEAGCTASWTSPTLRERAREERDPEELFELLDVTSNGGPGNGERP
jgi:hypothetical protein